jgi:Protein of unknown function (DUF1579)
MKTLKTLCLLLALTAVFGVLGALPAIAQKTSSEAARSLEEEARDKAKAMEEIEAHYKVIDLFAGSWTGTFKVVAQGMPPKELSVPATLESQWAFDHKWLQSVMFFDLGKDGAFRTTNFLGFNPGTHQLKSVSFTDGDPREMVEIGTWDEATKTLVFQGTMINYFTHDSFDRRETLKVLDADRFNYSLDFIFKDKTEIRAIDGVFTRKK